MEQKRKGGWPKGRPRSMSKEEWDSVQRQKQAAGTSGPEVPHGLGGEVRPQQRTSQCHRVNDVQQRLEGGQGREGQEARPREVQQPKDIPVRKQRHIINGRVYYCTRKEADRIMFMQAQGMPV